VPTAIVFIIYAKNLTHTRKDLLSFPGDIVFIPNKQYTVKSHRRIHFHFKCRMRNCRRHLTRNLVRSMERFNSSRLAAETSCGRWEGLTPRFWRKMRHGARLQPTRPCSTAGTASCNSGICAPPSAVLQLGSDTRRSLRTWKR
jgi:hypothetical protein